ncbi:O-antigen ligase family protein, partial [Candidatus Pelagibacter bacterium]
KKLAKLRLITLLSSIFILVIISYINPTAKERVFDQTLNQMNLINKDQKANGGINLFSEQHTAHYITAYKMFLYNKVLGVGVKNFKNFCSNEKYAHNKYSCSTHPHNTYIQILSETGIIGFVFLLSILFYFCKNILRHVLLKFKNKYYFTDFEICILSGVAIYLWPLVPTGNFFNNWLSILLILNIPFLIWSRKSYKR